MPWAVAAPLIGQGVGMLGSFLGGRGAAKKAEADKAARAAEMKPFLDTQQGVADKGTTQGFKQTKAAAKNLKLPANFWKRILSGDRTAIMEMLGPEVGAIHAQSNAMKNNLAQFAPRGGGLGAAMMDIGNTDAGKIGNLISSVRPRAAEELAEIGSRQGSLGSSLVGMGTGAASSALGALGGSQGREMEQANLNQNRGDSIWGDMGGALGAILASLGKRTGGGATQAGPPASWVNHS